MRWVKLTLAPDVRARCWLSIERLTSRSLAGTVRTLVAVGMASDASMLTAMRAAAPRRATGAGPSVAGVSATAGAAGAGAGGAVGAAGGDATTARSSAEVGAGTVAADPAGAPLVEAGPPLVEAGPPLVAPGVSGAGPPGGT